MMQKSDITVRRAVAQDIPAIAEIEKMCFSVPWSEKAIGETMGGENSLFLVAELGGEICGYIGSYHVLDEGYITNIAVDNRKRRLGVGKALVSELQKEGKVLSIKFWTLEVRVSNIGAISLYKNMGFEEVGKRPGFYSNPCEDALLMTFYTGKEENA